MVKKLITGILIVVLLSGCGEEDKLTPVRTFYVLK